MSSKNTTSKPGSLIRSTSGTSYGNDADALPTRARVRKSSKTSRGSPAGRFDFAISSSSMSPADSPLDHRPVNSIADLVLQPHHYTALLLQASATPDSRGRPTSADPGTGMHSRETSLDVPPPTPFPHDSICMDTPTIFVSEVDSESNALLEGITYDAILASTLHKNLGMMEGMKYLDIPATRTPPNSPAAVREGGFSSLVGVSMAIMEGRT